MRWKSTPSAIFLTGVFATMDAKIGMVKPGAALPAVASGEEIGSSPSREVFSTHVSMTCRAWASGGNSKSPSLTIDAT